MAKRLFITGDTHGEIDVEKLGYADWPEGRDLDDTDIVAICGDFGFPWDESAVERHYLDWYAEQPWVTVFVDGNHENFDLLGEMPVKRWHGGGVHVVKRDCSGKPKVVHLMRGQVYDLNGWKVFTLGGAQSHDAGYREPHITWWEQELPTPEEVAAAFAKFADSGWECDIMMTHCAPSRYQSRMHMAFEPDRFTDDLQGIADRLDYKLWAFGHYHMDRTMGNELCSYNAIWEVMREPTTDPGEYCVELPSGIFLRKSN